MSRSRNRGLTVAVAYTFPGPVGQLISDIQSHKLKRIKNNVEKQRQLGEVPNSEVVLEEYAELKSLDPDHWKDQDHYAVLGLPKLRHRATLEQIRNAYRKAVLKHHPDKRRRSGEQLINDNDDYFTCITRAYETLGSLETKRAYDSIDPQFDDDIPSANKNSRENFFEVFGPVFDLNSRWSVEQNVPFLGDKWSSIEEVDKFYEFWYNFNSWREYSYLDEENKEKAEDAYERRWMEKQNRAARATRKKEENQRIRQLVDNAYACDPRIKKYKDDEKRRREEEKVAKAEAIRKASEEKLAEERRLEQEKEDLRKQEEEESKRKQMEAKKEKDKEKKMLKKERQRLKAFCKKHNHFRESDSEQLEAMDKINHLCVDLSLLDIQKLNENIDKSDNVNSAKDLVEEQLNKLQARVDEERRKHLESTSGKVKNGTSSGDGKGGAKWSYEDLQILIKAVNLFPAGTNKRWDTVANYVNTHSSVKTRTGKECLGRAKNLKESELKAEANQKAFAKFQEKHLAETKKAVPTDDVITQRFDGPRAWSSDEQKRLEQALKTFPNSTPQRWDKIAESVTGRTKKECMLRYKELVEMVKAKKAMSQQGGKKT
uniref:DnaJ homolog subfamily C member 2 n=1 Tax=Phallusia mammillata TaxID=59560 RepID=A0A6F9DC01_9ASCI|nr:dnaJ homolog subfamily C member 2 [Phallusia mammillata]